MVNDRAALRSVNPHGRLMGFSNLFDKEYHEWWRRRSWLIRSLIWVLIINGIVLSVLKAPAQEGAAATPAQVGSMTFVIVSGLVTGMGIILTMQGAILDEKKSGTAAWVLSKPLSRPAFILAKLAANSLAALLIMVVVPGAVAFVQLSLFDPTPPALLPFLAGVGLIALHLLFYLTLTLMLGTIFKDRAAVIGLGIGLLAGAQLIAQMAPVLVNLMPWWIVMPQGDQQLALAHLVITGQPLPTVTPIIATVVLSIAFVGVALWRFGREEI